MDDLVTRLRYRLPFNLVGLTTKEVQELHAEAADEIERLRAELADKND
jgi:uncharacterized small protein (DUF1192 family)